MEEITIIFVLVVMGVFATWNVIYSHHYSKNNIAKNIVISSISFLYFY